MTTKYFIKADGYNYTIEGPDDATDEQVGAYLWQRVQDPDFQKEWEIRDTTSFAEGRAASFGAGIQNVAGAALDWAGQFIPEETAGRGRAYAREQTIDPLRDTYLTAAKENELKALYTMPENQYARFATETLDAFTTMVPIMAAGGGLGYALMGLEVGSKAYNDNIQRQLDAGVKPEDISRMRAAMEGGVKAAFEVIPEKLFGVLDNIGLAAKGKELIKAQAKKIILGEGGSEAVTELMNMLYDGAMYDEGPDSVFDGIKQVLYASAQGLALGGTMAGVQSLSTRKQRKEAEALLEMRKAVEEQLAKDAESQAKTNALRDEVYPEAEAAVRKERSYLDMAAGRSDEYAAGTQAEQDYGMLDQLSIPDLATERPTQEDDFADRAGARAQELRTEREKEPIKRGEARLKKMKKPTAAERFFVIQEELNMDEAVNQLSIEEQAAWDTYQEDNLRIAATEDETWDAFQKWQDNRPPRRRMEQLDLNLGQRPTAPIVDDTSPLQRDISEPPVIGPQTLYEISDEVASMTDEEILNEYLETAPDKEAAANQVAAYRSGDPTLSGGLIDEMRDKVLEYRQGGLEEVAKQQQFAFNLTSPELDTVAAKSSRLSQESKEAPDPKEGDYRPPVIQENRLAGAEEFPHGELKYSKDRGTGTWKVIGVDWDTGEVDVQFTHNKPDKMGKTTTLNYNWKVGDPTINKTLVDGVWSAKWKHGASKNRNANEGVVHVPLKLRREIDSLIASRSRGEVRDRTRNNPLSPAGSTKMRSGGKVNAQSVEAYQKELIKEMVAQLESEKGPQIKARITPQEIGQEINRMAEAGEITGIVYKKSADGQYIPDVRTGLNAEMVRKHTKLLRTAIRNVQNRKSLRNQATPEERARIEEQAKEKAQRAQGDMGNVLTERMERPVRWGEKNMPKLEGDFDLQVDTFIEQRDASMIGAGTATYVRAYQVLPNGRIRVLEIVPSEIGARYDIRVLSQGLTKYKGSPIVGTVGKPFSEKTARKMLAEDTSYSISKTDPLTPELIGQLVEKIKEKNYRRPAELPPGKSTEDYDLNEHADEALQQNGLTLEDAYIPENEAENERVWKQAWRNLPEKVEDGSREKRTARLREDAETRKGKSKKARQKEPEVTQGELELAAEQPSTLDEADRFLQEQGETLDVFEDGEILSLDDVRAEQDAIIAGQDFDSNRMAEETRMRYDQYAGVELTAEQRDVLDTLQTDVERQAYLLKLKRAGTIKAAAERSNQRFSVNPQNLSTEMLALKKAVAKEFGKDKEIQNRILRMAQDIRQGVLEIAEGILDPYFRTTIAGTSQQESPAFYVGDANNAMVASGASLTAVGIQQKHAARQALREVLRQHPEIILAITKAKYTRPTDDISDAEYKAIVDDAIQANRAIRGVVGEIMQWLKSQDSDMMFRRRVLPDGTQTLELPPDITNNLEETYQSNSIEMRTIKNLGRLPVANAEVEKLKQIEEQRGSQNAVRREKRRRAMREERIAKLKRERRGEFAGQLNLDLQLEEYITDQGQFEGITQIARDSRGRFLPRQGIMTSPNLEQKMAVEAELARLTNTNVVGEVAEGLRTTVDRMAELQAQQRQKEVLDKAEREFEAVREERRKAQELRDQTAREIRALRKMIREDRIQAEKERAQAEKERIQRERDAARPGEVARNRRESLEALAEDERLRRMENRARLASRTESDFIRETTALEQAREEEADLRSAHEAAKQQLELWVEEEPYAADGPFNETRPFSSTIGMTYDEPFEDSVLKAADELVQKKQKEYAKEDPITEETTGINNPEMVDLNNPDPSGRAGFEAGMAMAGIQKRRGVTGVNKFIPTWAETKRLGRKWLSRSRGLVGTQKEAAAQVEDLNGKASLYTHLARTKWAQASQALKKATDYTRFGKDNKWNLAINDYLQGMRPASVTSKHGVEIPQEALEHLSELKTIILSLSEMGKQNGAWSTQNVVAAVMNGHGYLSRTSKTSPRTLQQIDNMASELGALARKAWDVPTTVAEVEAMSHKRLLSLVQSTKFWYYQSHAGTIVDEGSEYKAIQMGADKALILGPGNKDSKITPKASTVTTRQLKDFVAKHLMTDADFAASMQQLAKSLVNQNPLTGGQTTKGASKAIQRSRRLLLSDANQIISASKKGRIAKLAGIQDYKLRGKINNWLTDNVDRNSQLSLDEFLMKATQQFPELKKGAERIRAEADLNLRLRESINELTDPESVIADTVRKLSVSVATADMLKEFYINGLKNGYAKYGVEKQPANWEPLGQEGTAFGDSTFALPGGPRGMVVTASQISVPREVAEAMRSFMNTSTDALRQHKVIGQAYKLSALGKWAAVIGNDIGLMRNFSSTMVIHLGRMGTVGTNSAWGYKMAGKVGTSAIAQALGGEAARSWRADKDAPATNYIIETMLKQHLLYDGALSGAILDLRRSGVGETTEWTKQSHSKLGVPKAYLGNALGEIFRLGDEGVKVGAFVVATSEYLAAAGHDPNLQKKAAEGKEKLTAEERAALAKAEKAGADMVKNHYPTFSRINDMFQGLSRFPLYFAFPGFNAEMIRTTFHSYLDNVKILTKGEMPDGTKIVKGRRATARALAATRLGTNTVMVGAASLVAKMFYGWALGDDDDAWEEGGPVVRNDGQSEQQKREMDGIQAWYNHGAVVAAKDIDKENHTFTSVQVDYALPMGSHDTNFRKVHDRIMRAIEDEDAPVAEEIARAAAEYALSFAGSSDPYFGNVNKRYNQTNITSRNKDGWVRKVANYIDEYLGGENAGIAGVPGAVAGATFETLMPKIIENKDKTLKLYTTAINRALENGDDEVAGYLAGVKSVVMSYAGLKETPMSWEEDVSLQVQMQKRALGTHTSGMMQALRDPKIKDYETFRAKFISANFYRELAFEQMHYTTAGAQNILGVPFIMIKDAVGQMENSQLTLLDVVHGTYRPPDPDYFSKQVFDDAKYEETPEGPNAPTTPFTYGTAEQVNEWYRAAYTEWSREHAD